MRDLDMPTTKGSMTRQQKTFLREIAKARRFQLGVTVTPTRPVLEAAHPNGTQPERMSCGGY